MKNVAGYDVSRLMTGAMGTLGVLLDISIKVLPATPHQVTLSRETTVEDAIESMQSLAGLGLPVTASAYEDGKQLMRIAGTETAVNASAEKLAGDKEEHPP